MRVTWTLALTLPILALGCNPDDATTEPGDGGGGGSDTSGITGEEPDILVDQALLWFGDVALGTAGTESITVTNRGDAPLDLLDLSVDDDALGFAVTQPATTTVEPGESIAISVTFTPQERADAEAVLLLTSNDPDEPRVEVALTGTGLGSLLVVDPPGFDFGSLYLGCQDDVAVTLSNEGNDDLVIDSFLFDTGSADLTIEAGGEDLGDLPWTVDPGQAISLLIGYAPMDELADTALLMVDTNDPTSPAGSFSFTGQGEIFGEATESFVVEHTTMADIVFAIDRSSSMRDDISTFLQDFHVLPQGVGGGGIDYQVAAVVDDDGCINGSSLFIDNSFSEGDITTAITDMVELSAPYGSNTEKAFTLWDAALSEASAGGCNEGLLRPGAALHLVGVSDEGEQSGGSYSTWVTLLESYASDPDDLVIHAIGGDYPSGCGTTSPYLGVYQATLATGGSFLSICGDMSTNLASLASGIIATTDVGAGTGTFALGQIPIPETLAVMVDGLVATSGWTYNQTANEVVFDDEQVPADGAVVEIDYVVTGECE